MEYPVAPEWKPCHLGGLRAYFRRGCGRRVAILFGGSIFACRQCHGLACQCQRETNDDRAMRLANNIQRQLECGAGIAGGKSEGMHRHTFERLNAADDTFANSSWAGMAERLGLMNRRLEKFALEP